MNPVVDYTRVYKLVITGKNGIGKSSLIMRFCEDKFSESLASTLGVDFQLKTLGKTKLQIWDTAGQERFAEMQKTYYRGAHGIIVVFDLTDKNSFERTDKCFERAGWKIDEENECWRGIERDTICILVGNKADLVDDRKVSHEEAAAKAEHYDVEYIETSAKSGNNVFEAFETLAERIREKERLFSDNVVPERRLNFVAGKDLLTPEPSPRHKNGCAC